MGAVFVPLAVNTDLEHGLVHNWHRHYDPTIGCYTTADPLGFVDGASVTPDGNG